MSSDFVSDIDSILEIFEDLKDSEKLKDNEYKTGVELLSKIRKNKIDDTRYDITIWIQVPKIRQFTVVYEPLKVSLMAGLSKCECRSCVNDIEDYCKYKNIYDGQGTSVSITIDEVMEICNIDLTDLIDENMEVIVISRKLN